jgi:NAD(P)-dependent dehydrogenase (short-subunit alcohol dehydrogenase family)
MSTKVLFITGSNSGFGLALALAIATVATQAGHTVIGTVRSEASGDMLSKKLPTLGTVLAPLSRGCTIIPHSTGTGSGERDQTQGRH